jgi:hypothetical protein
MTDNLGFAMDAVWRVLLVGLLFGAGLPVVFGLGVRSLAWAAGGDAEESHAEPRPIGKVLAVICFVIVVAGIALGLSAIIAAGYGKILSFENGYPTFVPKP